MGRENVKQVILFDLGQTLVDYFTRAEFPPLVEKALAAAGEALREKGRALPQAQALRERVTAENREAPDWCVRPLEERLGRIFGFDPDAEPDLAEAASRAFTDVLVAPGRLYEDTLPVLEELRRRGHRMGLVSNMPWGTPPEPWAEDLEHRGIAPYLEHCVFCRDIGWRKPDRRIFVEALCRFGCAPGDALFVGDRLDWDIQGAVDAGIRALLIDRDAKAPAGSTLTSLRDLLTLLA